LHQEFLINDHTVLLEQLTNRHSFQYFKEHMQNTPIKNLTLFKILIRHFCSNWH